MEQKVKDIIENKIRPNIKSHGGDIELVSVEDGIVRVRLRGACAGCPGAAMTLYHGVERILKQELPEMKKLEQVQ